MAGDGTALRVTPKERGEIKTRPFQIRCTDDDIAQFSQLAAEDGFLDPQGRGVSTWALEVLRKVARQRKELNSGRPRTPSKKRRRAKP